MTTVAAADWSALERIGRPVDQAWAADIFQRHHGADTYLKTAYIRAARSVGYVHANRTLEAMARALTFGQGHTATMDDDRLTELAELNAIKAKNVYHYHRTYSDIETIGKRLIAFCESEGVAFPLKVTRKDSRDDIARKTVAAAERASDARWWRRQLRKVTSRATEGVLRSVGFVRKGKAPYVSNWSLSRWRKAQKRNRLTLERLEAVTVDAHGDETALNLVDCIDASISNPTNRRHELMTRARGYQEIAEGLRLTGLFFTLTCPSKFHAQHMRGGVNANYDGSSPIDAMTHLNSTWAKIRSAWHKEGIKTFGFRVAEPHHDGTPHFHMMLFFSPSEVATAKRLFGEYAMEVDGDEPGAEKYRWNCKEIDPAKGSAAGYIAKYIAKNIDGFAVGTDDEGEVFAEEGASRVRAWASIWGIRQFQQIGSVSVTVWRELRRDIEYFEHLITDDPGALGVVDKLHLAADKGDWCEFVALMGGAFVSRSGQTLRPVYHDSEGGAVANRYGEGVKRLIGLWLNPVVRAIDRIIFTRTKVWEIRERGSPFKAAKPPPSDLCQ